MDSDRVGRRAALGLLAGAAVAPGAPSHVAPGAPSYVAPDAPTHVAPGTPSYVAPQPHTGDPLRLGLLQTLSPAPFYIAQERGTFRIAGIDLTFVFFQAAQPIAAAAVAGD